MTFIKHIKTRKITIEPFDKTVEQNYIEDSDKYVKETIVNGVLKVCLINIINNYIFMLIMIHKSINMYDKLIYLFISVVFFTYILSCLGVILKKSTRYTKRTPVS